jgi:O-acetyl-ADP-ribose deacetylase (regulator of RNase III)
MKCDERISLIKGDITKIQADAIVNAANSSLLGGGGVDGAIHRAAGKQMLEECIKIRNAQGNCKTGNAVITGAGNLKAKYIIHTFGPVWNGGLKGEPELLRNCYLNSFRLLTERDLKSIAFPCISTGIYRFPKELASKIAVETVCEILKNNEDIEKVIFVCFDDENYLFYEKNLF